MLPGKEGQGGAPRYELPWAEPATEAANSPSPQDKPWEARGPGRPTDGSTTTARATPYKFICLMNTPPKEGCTLYDDSEPFSFCCG